MVVVVVVDTLVTCHFIVAQVVNGLSPPTDHTQWASLSISRDPSVVPNVIMFPNRS